MSETSLCLKPGSDLFIQHKVSGLDRWINCYMHILVERAVSLFRNWFCSFPLHFMCSWETTGCVQYVYFWGTCCNHVGKCNQGHWNQENNRLRIRKTIGRVGCQRTRGLVVWSTECATCWSFLEQDTEPECSKRLAECSWSTLSVWPLWQREWMKPLTVRQMSADLEIDKLIKWQ